jgi:hypothetical protein
MRSVWLNALPSRVLVRVMVDVDVTVPLVTWVALVGVADRDGKRRAGDARLRAFLLLH